MKPAIAAVLLGLIGESVVFSAVVSVAAGSSPPGGSIILPISFASEGSSVSAVQFDLKYDSSVMSLGITAGDIAREFREASVHCRCEPESEAVRAIAV